MIEIICPNCQDGKNEDGDCYKCLGTGAISEEKYFSWRLRQVLEIIGSEIVTMRKKSFDANSEPWHFHAAENGMVPQEYDQIMQIKEADKASRVFEQIDKNGGGEIIIAIVNKFMPFDPDMVKKPQKALDKKKKTIEKLPF